MDDALTRAETFLWRNARLLERLRFAFHFRGGSRDGVVAALRAYQNADGGFGNALEPDIRCPESQPVPVQHALEVLDTVGLTADVAQPICDYLLTITTAEGGVPWLLPSALAYPHAPWWTTPDPAPAALNPTAAIAAVLHKNMLQHPWLERATAFCWAQLAERELTEMHELGVVLQFLYYVPDRERAEPELARLAKHLVASGLLADVQAEGYVRKPLDWAPTPDHPLRPFVEPEQIEAHLDLIAMEQQADGGWPITWEALSPGCELEWRGWKTLDMLLILRANGRLAR